MELKHAILERRTYRSFKPETISQAQLEELIQTAMWAPSAMNTQPWRFFVLSGQKKQGLMDMMSGAMPLLEERLKVLLKPKAVEATRKYFSNFGGAPHIIVVAYEEAENEIYDAGAVQSTAAAIQNLSLLAEEAGLGTCWMTGVLWLEKELLDYLGLKGMRLAAVLTIGYPDKKMVAPPRKHTEIIYME